jgi:hypothetical protein
MRDPKNSARCLPWMQGVIPTSHEI